jgi:hypothetical protein
MSVLCAWLLLMRRAGWFDPFREADEDRLAAQRPSGRTTAARWAASVLFVVVTLFPVYIFYRLLTPAPIPDMASPRPNSYDDLVAAGRMIGESDETGIWQLRQLSGAQLREAVSKNSSAYAIAHAALLEDCRFPLMGLPIGEHFLPNDELRALFGLRDALYGRLMLAQKGSSVDEKLTASLDLLRLNLYEARSSGTDEHRTIAPSEYYAFEGLWQCRSALDVERCVELANELWELEQQRATWEDRVERQRIIAENSGWERHVRSILNGWSSHDHYEGYRYVDWLRRVEMRMLIAELAVRAFQHKNDRLPATLAELVPDYLPALPDDPYDLGQPLKYRETGDGYVLYSVGPDKMDDGGMPRPKQAGELGGDLIDADLFPAPANPPAANTPGAADAVDEEASENASEGQGAEVAAEPEP